MLEQEEVIVVKENNMRSFKKGTCACESSSKINSKMLSSRKVNYIAPQAKGLSNIRRRSIKSRFL